MAFEIRYIHGPREAGYPSRTVSPDTLGVGKSVFFGSHDGAAFPLGGRGVHERQAFIKREGTNEYVFVNRTGEALVRAGGEKKFKRLSGKASVRLSHGMLIKIGDHLFDVIDRDKVKPGEVIRHEIPLLQLFVMGRKTGKVSWRPAWPKLFPNLKWSRKATHHEPASVRWRPVVAGEEPHPPRGWLARFLNPTYTLERPVKK